MKKLELQALPDLPEIKPGDDLASLICLSASRNEVFIQTGDVFVVAQKIVSKAENRFVNLADVVPSPRAVALARAVDKDARFVELILQESDEVLRTRPGTIIVEHKLGFICANAGIDHSNVLGKDGNPEDWVLLLPKDPDRSAEKIRRSIERKTRKKIGLMIIDSHGRAWREGVVGCVIGISGLPGVIDMRGTADRFGYKLRVTKIAAADELAAGASLLMGQAAEGTPVIHVRGFPYTLRASNLGEILRTRESDLFR